MRKRLFDFIGSAIALMAVLPVLAAAMVLVKLTSPGPVFFIQERVGQHGRTFGIYKLRSMFHSLKASGRHLTMKNDTRVTPFGRLMRKCRIDELPQLLNVLKGDMGLVGPRPEVPRYVNMFRADYEVILQVKPGITDYASIAFRNETEMFQSPETYEKEYVENIMPAKIGLYREYVRNQSLSTDLDVLAKTLCSLIGIAV